MTSVLPASVPPAAQYALDFIGGTEAPNGFGTIYGNNQGRLPKVLTSMTLGDVIDAQPDWSKRFGSSAAGRYQFMRATLQGICKEVPSLRGDALFDAALQNRLGYYLLQRRGIDDFIAGRISMQAFGKSLAQEWASFPVLTACKGATRLLDRGQSYYAGDGVNKALVSPEAVEKVLSNILKLANPPAAPPPAPTPNQVVGVPVIAPPAAAGFFSQLWSKLGGR